MNSPSPETGPAVPEIPVFSVFSNGSEYRDWVGRNCDRCSVCGARDYGPSACELETALSMASMLDGTIPVSLGVEFGAVQSKDFPEYYDLPGRCPKFAPAPPEQEKKS